MRKVDVVIPVYGGLEDTRQCVESALATVDPSWARVVIINDASPEPEITRYLREQAARNADLILMENKENLGFTATANRGLRHDPERDVLLLNSDVVVANDWLARLRIAIYEHGKTGSLSPFSNNATICSFPNLCKDNELLFGLSTDELDKAFAETAAGAAAVRVPTTVGYCMYIRRACLNDVGYFDEETFGRGYGEENDWCQRAEQAGWQHGHLPNCFVYHKGGVSFAEEQDPRIARAMEILDERYPEYHASIQEYIAMDPAKTYRSRALLTLFAAQERPKILYISHKLGGGAQQHVNELATLYKDQALFLQITPDKDGESITLSFFDRGERLQDGLYFDVDREYDKLVRLLTDLGVGHVHFHHTMGLHPRLWVLAQALGCRHDLTIHDYYLINGNPTLTDEDAIYVAESAKDFDERCGQHYPLPEGITAESWRDNQRLLVEGSRRVIFPSHDVAARFRRFFQIEEGVVAWHPDYELSKPYPEPVWPFTGERPLKVLVLGAISREKGADVLESVADAMSDSAIEFHLLGYAYRGLSEDVITHGPYAQEDVYELVRTLAPDVVWYPALWPETYSYTLSVALHLGLPVVVPDIGAFVERVAQRPLSVVLPWNSSVADWRAFWSQIISEGQLPVAQPLALDPTESARKDFYSADYLQPVQAKQGAFNARALASLSGNYHVGVPQLTGSEKILGRIWRISRRPVVAKMVSLVPFRMQQAIKRRLSRRPMHDIVR
jgi:GT2 family glycosyltransferase/glycosyltransferase involved in cell wall biosynthesis